MRIGRYEIFGPFATGGMASVHFGKLFASAGFQRIVAIKVPHVPFVRDPELRSMFLDEARIVARIRSPHVVATLEILEEGDTLYQVMEYASGPPLSSVLRTMRGLKEPIPISLVLTIVADALEGLHAAHEVKGEDGAPLHVVHRDVSPQNILVTDDGIAKVIDFGIASAAGKLHHTQPGDLKGKVGYMSPEQIEGRRVDRRADVYAVGVVLYETLTGQKPFIGQDFASTALMHVLHPAPDPRALRPEVSDELAAIVARALEKKPQERFPTARAMADALLALPTSRMPPREAAEWFAETSREFFAERSALIAALPEFEATDSAHSHIDPDAVTQTETPTPAELRAPGSTPTYAATSPSSEPQRASRLRWRAGMVVLLAVCAGVAAIARVTTLRPTEDRRAPVSDALSSASAPGASAAPAEPVQSTTDLQPADNPLSYSASSTSLVRAPPPPRPGGPGGPGKRAKTSSAAASVSAPLTQPACCSGDLRIRLTNCVDNCPSGT
jgi:serine/threonine protein kinase